MSASWNGALLGLVFGCSALLVISRLRATSPLTLRERITPFVPQLRTQSLDLQVSTINTLRSLLPIAPSRRTSPGERARESGVDRAVAAAIGVAVGSALGFTLAYRGHPGLLVPVLAVLGGVVGEVARSTMHGQARRARVHRIGVELPDFVELFAFAVAAGESPAAALARVGPMTRGELGALVTRAASEMRLGLPLDVAMRDLVVASGSSDVERFVDSLLLAVERGTPLSDVLRAQAADARAVQSRRLMESAGRKDVAMLIPVVFLILPTVVLIALFPGFQSLHLFIN